MGKTIIPDAIPQFNTWIRNTNTRQLAINPDTTNPFWQDYGWSIAQSNAYKTDWHDEWVLNLYPKWSNALLKTKQVNADVETFMKNFSNFVEDELLIAKIKASGIASNADAITWNFTLERSEPTVRTEPIATDIVPEVISAGRGKIEVEVRAHADQKRPNIPREDGADSVQYAWKVFATKAETANPDLTPDDMTKDINTKAAFEFDAGFVNQGKWLVIYFRWYNTKHPELAGDWCSMITMAIS
jgi:hypothetical protein